MFEEGLRSAMQKDACKITQMALQYYNDQLPSKSDADWKNCGKREVTVNTIFGKVPVKRTLYHHRRRSERIAPFDESLGLYNRYTPTLVKLILHSGSHVPVEKASEQLKLYGGIEVSGRQIHRMIQRETPDLERYLENQKQDQEASAQDRSYIMADGTGVPLRKKDLEGVSGKQADGSAKTKEAKLGCYFTQSNLGSTDEPFRDLDSTSYVGTLEPANEFSIDLRRECLRRGIALSKETVFIADGAAWLWNMSNQSIKPDVEILDYYHAKEHLHELVECFLAKDSPEYEKQIDDWKELWFQDKVDQMIHEAKNLSCEDAEILKKIVYFENNAHRMKYGTYKSKGYFYGSGVIEAGCKNVIGQRMKQSGMQWSKQGAENMLTLRTAFASGRVDGYFEEKRAA